MKIAALSVLILFFFTIPGFAQLQLAPISGLNISKLRISKKPDTGISYFNTNGFMVGLNAKYAVDDRYKVQLEGVYSQKGFESEIENQPGRIVFHLNYIDVLLLGEYSVNDIIALNIGGNFGSKIGEKINGAKSSSPELFHGKDIGLIAGLKFYIGQLFIRTTYQHGFNPIAKVSLVDENGVPIGQANEYNQTFQVAVGYYFTNSYPRINP